MAKPKNITQVPFKVGNKKDYLRYVRQYYYIRKRNKRRIEEATP